MDYWLLDIVGLYLCCFKEFKVLVYWCILLKIVYFSGGYFKKLCIFRSKNEKKNKIKGMMKDYYGFF